MTLNTLRRLNLGTKLSVGNTLLIAALLAAFVAALGHSLSDAVEIQAKREVTEKTQLLARLIEASDRDMRMRTESLARAFDTTLSGHFELKRESANIDARSTPVLALNGHPLNLDFQAVDSFSETTGSVATLFVRSGDDFVRVTTSVKNEKGERAVGTLLDREHPAYKAILSGANFIGTATLFGRNYMTRYAPIKDETGQTIGVSFVGLDFTAFMNTLKSTIRELKIGQTGYFLVLDARLGKNLGNLVVHPSLEGKNLLDAKDAHGTEFIKQMLELKTGVIQYAWTDKEQGAGDAREKVAAFTYIKEWNWIISGGTYVDEFTADIRDLRNKYSALALMLVLAMSAVSYTLIRKLVSRPLAKVQNAVNKIAEGDLTIQLRTRRLDEVGALIGAINSVGSSLASVVEAVRQNSENVATASAEIAQGNQDLSDRTESHAGALEQTSAAVQQLGVTVKNNVALSREAHGLTQGASQVAHQGGAVMTQVIATMKGINGASLRIADIVAMIDGIAFQTNILALNAAVEAARAGDAGRGFAVVASEVRSLASRSAAAAKEIKALISDSVSRVEAGSALVDQAGLTISEVVSSIQRISSIMDGISSASIEQATGVQQVGQAVIQMDEGTQQNAALVEQMAAATSGLAGQAKSLVQSVAVFKLDANPEPMFQRLTRAMAPRLN